MDGTDLERSKQWLASREINGDRLPPKEDGKVNVTQDQQLFAKLDVLC